MIVLHQVNCRGVMGAGFAKYVRSTFPNCYEEYRKHCTYVPASALLGTITTYTEGDYTIINMFSQLNYGSGLQTNYKAMENALRNVRKLYPTEEIIAPYKIRCGLAGGDWTIVSELLNKYNIITSENIVFKKENNK